MSYREIPFLGPEKVLRDYKNRAKLRKALKAKRRAVVTLERQIEDLERRTNWAHAGGVTEVYEGFPLRIDGVQTRELKAQYDSVEVWQGYDTSEDGWRIAKVYKLQYAKEELDKHDNRRYGLNIVKRAPNWGNRNETVMFLSKKDAVEQAKRWVALGEIPPKMKEKPGYYGNDF
jgi:hypothetical protein